MQRVLAVRLVRTAHGLTADAVGVLHHRPVVQRIPMGTARALVARGVPVRGPAPTGDDAGPATSGGR